MRSFQGGMSFSLMSVFSVMLSTRLLRLGYYPNLIAMYNYLGVVFRASNFSYSFSSLSTTSTLGTSLRTRLLYNGSSGLGGISLPTERSPSSTPIVRGGNIAPVSFSPVNIACFIFVTLPSLCLFGLYAVQLLFNFVRLGILSIPVFYSRTSIETFRQWTERTTPSGFLARLTGADASWLSFVHEIVLPLFSAVCTASDEDVYNHPAAEILGMILPVLFPSGGGGGSSLELFWGVSEYIWKTHFTSHYVVSHNIRDAVARMTRPLPTENIHLSSTITALRLDPREPSTTEITYETINGTAVASGFHHIIFATQANNGIPILESYATSLPLKSPQRQYIDAQIACLRRFKYTRTVVVNHTDETLIPSEPQDQRDLNLVCAQPDVPDYSSSHSNCVPPNYTMATHIIQCPPPPSSGYPTKRSLSPLPPQYVVYQTTNPIIPPRKECILSTAVIERAVLTADSKIAQRELMTEEDAPLYPFGLSISISRPSTPKHVLLPFVVSVKRRRIRKLGPVQGAGRLQAAAAPSALLSPSPPSYDDKRYEVREHDIEAIINNNDTDVLSAPPTSVVIPPGIWLCGSYAHPGIPLLEACVTSALNVVENGIFVAERVHSRADWVPR